jgi:excisionase family DNA binding protein
MADERWFTTKQIAELLQVIDATVWRWLKSGQMRGINLSGKSSWRVRESEVNAFIEAREGKVAT